jgi:hypothetical protein
MSPGIVMKMLLLMMTEDDGSGGGSGGVGGGGNLHKGRGWSCISQTLQMECRQPILSKPALNNLGWSWCC